MVSEHLWNKWLIYDKQKFCNPFCANLARKSQNCLFKVKFGDKTNSNRLNLMMMFESLLDRKYPFWVNLVQKIKIIHLT